MKVRKQVLPILLLTSLAFSAQVATGESLAIRAGTLYTMAGDTQQDAIVLIQDGSISTIGSESEVNIPEGATILEAAVVTPGLIDAHTVVGLAGYLNTNHDQDQLEKSSPIQPELRALDAYNAREHLIDWLRSFGVTTLHTGHGPGALVSGETMIVKTRGDSVEEAVMVPRAMVAATLGEGATVGEKKAPGTRAKAVALLRAELIKAREYSSESDSGEEDGPKDRDLRLEALSRVLSGEVPLLVTVNRHQDIATALRLQREFGFRMVLDGAAEAYQMINEIHAAEVPVIVHPTMARASGERENLSMETAATLADAGIVIAIQSGYESYVPKTRVVLFEAAVAAAHNLGFERALGSVTRDAAKILGIDDRVGTIEVGKDGDLALFDGDPFEYTTHCIGTVIEGEVVSEEAH